MADDWDTPVGDFGLGHVPAPAVLEEIVTATVTAEPPPTTRDIAETKKMLVPLPKDLTASSLGALARDIAMDLQSLDDILQTHGLTRSQYEFLENDNKYFKNLVEQQSREWQSIGSTQDRLRAQAAAALEVNLPAIAGRMGKATEDLSDAVEAAKLFAKIAGVDATPAGARSGGEGFTITLDLGADTRLTIGSTGDPPQGSPAADLREVRDLREGKSALGPLPEVRQVQGGKGTV